MTGYLRRFPSKFGSMFWLPIWAGISTVQQYVLSHNVQWMFHGVTSRLYCNVDAEHCWGQYNQPIHLVMTFINFRVAETFNCPESWMRSLTFLGAHSVSTYLVHTHWIAFPSSLTWLLRTQEIQSIPIEYAVHHWDLSPAVFLVCVACDLFHEHFFKMNKMLFWSASKAMALQVR
jgi:hypothetical protein